MANGIFRSKMGQGSEEQGGTPVTIPRTIPTTPYYHPQSMAQHELISCSTGLRGRRKKGREVEGERLHKITIHFIEVFLCVPVPVLRYSRFTRYNFVACDMLTTRVMFGVNQTYNLLAVVVYDTKKVVGF